MQFHLYQAIIMHFFVLLGYLNPSTDDPDLKKGAKLELPFWLAQKLKNDDKRVLSVAIPKPYVESYRDMYKAEAEVVDLHALGPNFYNLAMKMPLIDSVQSKDITASALLVSFHDFGPTHCDAVYEINVGRK